MAASQSAHPAPGCHGRNLVHEATPITPESGLFGDEEDECDGGQS